MSDNEIQKADLIKEVLTAYNELPESEKDRIYKQIQKFLNKDAVRDGAMTIEFETGSDAAENFAYKILNAMEKSGYLKQDEIMLDGNGVPTGTFSQEIKGFVVDLVKNPEAFDLIKDKIEFPSLESREILGDYNSQEVEGAAPIVNGNFQVTGQASAEETEVVQMPDIPKVPANVSSTSHKR